MSGGDRRITNPVQALWQEVLWLAVDEALHGPKHVERKYFARMCREARDYITKPSRDLAMVCALASVDMDAVIDRMQQRLPFSYERKEESRRSSKEPNLR